LFLDERARGCTASWNVANAGVDGLLARPLFVVTVDVCGTGGSDSLLRSFSSGFLVSFLLPVVTAVVVAAVVVVEMVAVVVGVGTGGADAVSVFSASFLGFSVLIGALVSFGVLGSAPLRSALAAGAPAAGVLAAIPLGLLEADDVGLALLLSVFTVCIEFCRERVRAGFGVGTGTGDARTGGSFGSGSSVMTGDELTELDKPVTPFLLQITMLEPVLRASPTDSGTYLFLDWPLPEGRAFLFLGASGAGVALGLVVFAFGAAFPKTELIARSVVAAAPLVVFSTLRRFCGGLPLLVAAVEMPSPTLAVSVAVTVFRDLAVFFGASGLCLPSWSSPSESWLWALEWL